MNWLTKIAHAFIMTFGITQPSPEHERTASIFIGALLLALVLGVIAIIFLGVHMIMS